MCVRVKVRIRVSARVRVAVTVCVWVRVTVCVWARVRVCIMHRVRVRTVRVALLLLAPNKTCILNASPHLNPVPKH